MSCKGYGFVSNNKLCQSTVADLQNGPCFGSVSTQLVNNAVDIFFAFSDVARWFAEYDVTCVTNTQHVVGVVLKSDFV